MFLTNLTTKQLQHLFVALVMLASFIVLHVINVEYDLYYAFSWLDIVSHTVGGIILGLALAIVFSKAQHLIVLAGTVFVVALWELFELFVVKIPIVNTQVFVYDTILDVFFGIGAAMITAFLYWSKIR